MCFVLALNVQNRVGFWGSAPDPGEGAYDAPPDPLVVRGFLPSAIAASRLWRLQFNPDAHVLVAIPASKPPFHPFAPQPPSSGYATVFHQFKHKLNVGGRHIRSHLMNYSI